MNENWRYIVGKDLAKVSSFNNVAQNICGEIVANINVVSSAIMYLKEKEKNIINAIYNFSNVKYCVNYVSWKHTAVDIA